MVLAPHLLYGGDQGGLGLGMETAAMTPQEPQGLQQPKAPDNDKGYDFGDVMLNFVFRGYPAALERLDLQKKDRVLAMETSAIETKRRQAMSNTNRAGVAFNAGKLEKAAKLLGTAYESFPDGMEYGGIRNARPDEKGNKSVYFKDKNSGEMTASFPLNKESIGYALKEARAGLQGDAFMKGQIARLAERRIENAKLLNNAQKDNSGTYSWQHRDRNDAIVWKQGTQEDLQKAGGRYNEAQAEAEQLKKDLAQNRLSLGQEQLKKAKDPRQNELLGLRIDKAKVDLKAAKDKPKDDQLFQVGDRQMTTKQIEGEMKTLKSALAPIKGDKPLMLITEMLKADEGDVKTELDRLEKLTKKGSPRSKEAAQRYLELFRAITGMTGETSQPEPDTPGALLKKYAIPNR